MNEPDVAEQLALAQLRRTELENEKLALELARQGKAPAWYQFPIQFVPLITALVAVAGFLWGVVQYTNAQRKDRAAREVQSVREKEIAEREFMKPWLESQRSIYLEALTAAAAAVNSREPKVRAAAAQSFWQLYNGRMILVETQSVSDAMVEFGRCLDGSNVCNPEELDKRTHALASAIAASMAATAKLSYQEFAANQFRYSPGAQD